MSLRLRSVIVSCLVAASCTPMVEPELTLTASPRTLDGVGQKAVIRVSALDAEGKPGTGTVRVSSAAGSLMAGAEISLAAGEGLRNGRQQGRWESV